MKQHQQPMNSELMHAANDEDDDVSTGLCYLKQKPSNMRYSVNELAFSQQIQHHLLSYIKYTSCRLLRLMIPASVHQSVTRLCCENIAEWIEVLSGVRTLGGLENILLDKGP